MQTHPMQSGLNCQMNDKNNNIVIDSTTNNMNNNMNYSLLRSRTFYTSNMSNSNLLNKLHNNNKDKDNSSMNMNMINTENKSMRNESGSSGTLLNNSENLSQEKPNLNSLPFIMRSNSLKFNNCHSNNLIYSHSANCAQNDENYENENDGYNSISRVNSVINANANTNLFHSQSYQTPKSKKDEIKKWMSRI
jgi:hypothetical protein